MNRLIQDLVSDQAQRRPDATAILMGDTRYTYGELEAGSNRLANLLRAEGLAQGDRVTLFLPKCPEAVLGMLGVLKAGGTYVPIDVSSPAPRAARILRACEPRFALVTAPGRRLLDQLDHGGRTVVLAHGKPEGLEGALGLDDAARQDAARPDPGTTPDDLAHILFTSGSTGDPKGVMITHRNVASYVEWSTGYFGVKAGERVSGHPPLHFDLSTSDIYGTLSRGAELHMVPAAMNLLPHKLVEFIREHRLNQWFSVPSILNYLCQADALEQDDFPEMTRLQWCGEVLPTPTLIYLMGKLPHVTFTNLYGPTEATIASSYYTVPACPEDPRAATPIGRACGGEELLVLDAQLRPVAPGEIGDLYIRGVGLSPGYWRDAEKTDSAFLPHPDAPVPGDRIYRTGDLAHVDDAGLFHFHGRKDTQIKSRGYRIELGEIESALLPMAFLKESAVVGAETGGFEGTAICCAYAPEAQDVTPAKISAALREGIPGYMIPTRWKAYESLPKNANGKIDRRALREAFEAEIAQGNAAP